jgi:hypothetical protein
VLELSLTVRYFTLKTTSFFANQTKNYPEICQMFEQKYRMTSDEFLLKFESGELGDSQDFFDWFAAKRALDLKQTNQDE